MERKDGKVIAIAALFIGVIGLSVGFASLQTSLQINGSATVKSSKWDVHFANLTAVTKTGDATEVTAPTIKSNNSVASTLIGDYSVTLTSPGDSISYKFDITNAGDYNAKISSITIPTPTCTGNGTNALADANNVCSKLTYTLTYTDGGAVAKDDTLTAGQTKNVTLKLAYSDDIIASELPKDDVSITNLQIPIVYVQY